MFWTFHSLSTASGGPALGRITIPGCEFLNPQDKQQARSVSQDPEHPIRIVNEALARAIKQYPYAVAAFQAVIKELKENDV